MPFLWKKQSYVLILFVCVLQRWFMGDGNGGWNKMYRQRSTHWTVRQGGPYEAMVARSTHGRHAAQTSRSLGREKKVGYLGRTTLVDRVVSIFIWWNVRTMLINECMNLAQGFSSWNADNNNNNNVFISNKNPHVLIKYEIYIYIEIYRHVIELKI